MRNPVIPGFYPDPSVCRVGETYYLATSSFSFHPGIPLFESTDLVNWEPVGHALTDHNFDFSGLEISDGVWAPTIRHHQDTFYVVFSVSHGTLGMRTYLVTAPDITGPWSAPKQLEVSGFDPSILFEGDKAWLTICRDAEPRNPLSPGALWLVELDIETLQVTGPETHLWAGALKGAWVEAPRLFVHNGVYWLIAAEGGTERKHAVTAAWSNTIVGPYRGDDRNPLLTHRHLGEATEIANVGHADLVDDPDGNWWAVVLGVRPIDGFHVLGREVFVVPVEWDNQGLVFAPGDGRVLEEISQYRVLKERNWLRSTELGAQLDSGAHTYPAQDLAWVSALAPVQHACTEASVELNLNDPSHGSHTGDAWLENALMTRQRAHNFGFTATVNTLDPGRVAHVFAFQKRARYVKVSLEKTASNWVVVVERNNEGELSHLNHHFDGQAQTHEPQISISSDSRAYAFNLTLGDSCVELCTEPHEFFSTESAGGFVGTMLGLSVTQPDQPVVSSSSSVGTGACRFTNVVLTNGQTN